MIKITSSENKIPKNKKILITSALPYVNNVPHLGNIVGCVLSADVFARYCRSRGHETLYICGTDEYGTATEIKALEEGVTPKEICEKYHKIHKEIYEWFGINFDYFGRTFTPAHTEITQQIFLKLNENGYIAEGEVEQLYDELAGMFLADRYVEGTCPFCGYVGARGDQCDGCGKVLNPDELIKPKSKITKTVPIKKKTRHLFIDLPKIEPKLKEWVDAASVQGDWDENAVAITRSWLAEGLRKRAITRDLKWGVPVPLEGFREKVFYVWFEAPIGYLSITANYTGDWEKWWKNPQKVALYQFMGKDNVPFHSVMFPSTLIGAGGDWTLLHHLSTTEFLNYEGGKFSKSRNVGVFGSDAKNSGIPADVWRYYLLKNRPEQADTNFCWEDFREKTNNELIANLGNLVNRATVFIRNNFDGKVPEAKLNLEDEKFLKEQRKKIMEVGASLDAVKIKGGLQHILEFGKNANRYFQDNAPWELAKSDLGRCGTVMHVLANQLKDLAIISEPYLPHASKSIFGQLGIEPLRWADAGELSLEAGHCMGKPAILFRKLEEKQMKELKEKFSGKGPGKEKISFADVDLEVGEIVSVREHPDAEKLYVEKVKMGNKELQVVSGLVGHISAEDLNGKKVIIVKNLAPAKLRGVESQGMLLVAEDDEGNLEVLEPEAEVGEKVVAEGVERRPRKEISFKEFGKVKFSVEGNSVFAEGIQLLAGKNFLKTKRIGDGKVS